MNLIEENIEKFNIYRDFLIEENQKYNLTSITDFNEIKVKHFEDSIAMKDYIDLSEVQTLCDVGSGAGFPAIPLKICFPHLKITIIEPTLKRINFLKMLVEKIGLKDVTLINARAEDVANDYLESFDICTARAVANTSILLELLVKMVKVNGKIILYKGDRGIEEASEAIHACNILDLKYLNGYRYQLANNYGNRCLLEYLKVKPTKDKYPRRYAEIKKKPL